MMLKKGPMHPLPCGRGSEGSVVTTAPFRAARASKRLFDFLKSVFSLLRRRSCLRQNAANGSTAERSRSSAHTQSPAPDAPRCEHPGSRKYLAALSMCQKIQPRVLRYLASRSPAPYAPLENSRRALREFVLSKALLFPACFAPRSRDLILRPPASKLRASKAVDSRMRCERILRQKSERQSRASRSTCLRERLLQAASPSIRSRKTKAGYPPQRAQAEHPRRPTVPHRKSIL